MSLDRIRIYDAGNLYDSELPDWYRKSERLSEEDRINWHRALDCALDCVPTQLAGEGAVGGGLEIRFWPSDMHGTFVLIETPLAIVEQVLVLNPTDWLPFLSKYLAPLIMASTQNAMVGVQGKLANALIAWARYGEGAHVDRETGLSRIDLDNDRDRRRAEQFRQAMAQAGKAAGA
ncbi:MAG: hypothetical protein ACQEUZ_04850 [Pseudomonadota bacterium]